MKKQGLSRACRLTERPQFLRLFQNPRVYRAQTFQAFWLESTHPRLGITIKGRLGSVHRSRVKRTIREWFRQVKQDIGINDLNIVIHTSGLIGKNYQELLHRDLWNWKHGKA